MRALSGLTILFALLAAPFIWTSLAVDVRGVTVPGLIRAKRENVRVQHNDWSRSSEITIEYEIPETRSETFFNVTVRPEEYDSFHVGQQVSLHYLRAEDVPHFPMAHALRQMHALPMARLASKRAFSSLDRKIQPKWIWIFFGSLALALVLVTWRFVWRSTFWWPAGAVIAGGVALLFLSDFPRPTQKPVADVQHAIGQVKYVTRISRLLESPRSRGIDAEQPVDVVEVAFVPANYFEPVLAVDLIDTGSVKNLKEGSNVPVSYERRTPRIAYLDGAKRDFAQRNFLGALEDGIIYLLVLACLFGLWKLCSRWVKRRLGT